MKQRLQKILSQAGIASRRKSETIIEAGRVSVNGRTASLGESADPQKDRICVDGRPLPAVESKVCLLLNKPAGYVTTASDPQGRATVLDLVPKRLGRLFPVGRLDLTTEGALLLTNDGDLAFRLTHPKHEIEKVYLVKVRGRVDRAEIARMERGLRLEDGMTAPAKVAAVRHTGKNTWFEMTLHEGRNRQVRRMCEAIGHPVVRLRRVRFAFLDLEGLAPGHYRHLGEAELKRLKELT
ncbi:MAG: rRNA pseudouridine synthase [Desulfuromonadales bacterium]|nr:rRNA pseudouridine synthase [Desulfuromonadales bacterium]NIR34180.1 rRNA pseudouridine synthase [Desulfuromonadales bacterium]NIS41627.1 rRNA pseudouridine synthase [Desulfuromonadales bacterium]